ncbi:MAG: hypothetical protein EA417_21460 [Gammaproteobacteria bacterium]|nr:MAG: hypothetical protein EA417_21460 [Gammaproteobacteria bacterium]
MMLHKLGLLDAAPTKRLPRARQRVEVGYFPREILKQAGRTAISGVELDHVATAGAGVDAGAGRSLIGAQERKQ